MKKKNNLRKIIITTSILFFVCFSLNSIISVSESSSSQDIPMSWVNRTPIGCRMVDIDVGRYSGVYAIGCYGSSENPSYYFLKRDISSLYRRWDRVCRLDNSMDGIPIRIAAWGTYRSVRPVFVTDTGKVYQMFSVWIHSPWWNSGYYKYYFIEFPTPFQGARDVSIPADGSVWVTAGYRSIYKFNRQLNKWIDFMNSCWPDLPMNLDVHYTYSGNRYDAIYTIEDGTIWGAIIHGDVCQYTISWDFEGAALSHDVGIIADYDGPLVMDNPIGLSSPELTTWFTDYEQNTVFGGYIYSGPTYRPTHKTDKGAGVRITVDTYGNPWVINTYGEVFEGRVIGPSGDIPEWKLGETYSIGDIVSYKGYYYECIQAHTAYVENWAPPYTPALWKRLSTN